MALITDGQHRAGAAGVAGTEDKEGPRDANARLGMGDRGQDGVGATVVKDWSVLSRT
jgi:hypothetical protein